MMKQSKKHKELDRINNWHTLLTDIANAMDEHDESTHLSDHIDSIIDDLESRTKEILGDDAIVTFREIVQCR